jgi:hypothetical protein
MMAGGFVWGLILSVVLLLGFAYIVWVLAVKESGNVKIIGQVIAVIIAILALVVLIYGVAGGGSMGRMGMYGHMGMYDKKDTMGGGMKSKDGMKKSIDMMMKDPEMRKYMNEHMKKAK